MVKKSKCSPEIEIMPKNPNLCQKSKLWVKLYFFVEISSLSRKDLLLLNILVTWPNNSILTAQ